MTEININCLKISTDWRQTSWLFKQHSQGVELRVHENKFSDWQGGRLELRTTRLEVQHPNHLAVLPPNKISRGGSESHLVSMLVSNTL